MRIQDKMEAPSGRKRIAIVDDEPQLLQLYQTLLTSKGHDVAACFTDGSLIVNAGRNFPDFVDVVLMDYRMTVMDGLAAAKLIRQMNPKIKVVLITASDSTDDLRKTGLFQEVLMKPAKVGEILAAVELRSETKILSE
jgi:two-component system, response regulator PdtaR